MLCRLSVHGPGHGGRGIGAAIADALAAAGANVTLMGRDLARLDAHAAQVALTRRSRKAEVSRIGMAEVALVFMAEKAKPHPDQQGRSRTTVND